MAIETEVGIIEALGVDVIGNNSKCGNGRGVNGPGSIYSETYNAIRFYLAAKFHIWSSRHLSTIEQDL